MDPMVRTNSLFDKRPHMVTIWSPYGPPMAPQWIPNAPNGPPMDLGLLVAVLQEPGRSVTYSLRRERPLDKACSCMARGSIGRQ